MHKDFYASGFLYNPQAQQILLQQQITADENSQWSLFGKRVGRGKSGEETFLELIFEHLKLKLKLKNVFYVYTKFASGKNQDHSIYYAIVKRKFKLPLANSVTFEWFSFKQLHKLSISEQTKHDIMIGQRVIDSAIRKSLGLKTIG